MNLTDKGSAGKDEKLPQLEEDKKQKELEHAL